VTEVLVVDPDRAVRRSVGAALRDRGYGVEVVRQLSGVAGAVRRHRPDVVIIDPTSGGAEVVLRRLHGLTDAPIIVLAPSDDAWDKIAALDAGADDYVSKPFNVEEVLARLRVALRRSPIGADPGPPPIVTTSFTVDVDDRRWLGQDGVEVRLTPVEWRIVEILVRHPGRLVSHEELLRTVWGTDEAGKAHYLRVHMAAIRRKVEPDPAHPRHFVTVPGIGLRFEPEPELVRTPGAAAPH